MVNRDSFPGCCAAKILSNFDTIISKRGLKIAYGEEYYGWGKRYYAILDINYQAKVAETLLDNGWERVGRKWKNPSTNNTLQMYTYFKPKK